MRRGSHDIGEARRQCYLRSIGVLERAHSSLQEPNVAFPTHL